MRKDEALIDGKTVHVGPEYPTMLGATVSKFRTAAREGLQALSRDDRRDYGAAVEKAIRALQHTELMRGLERAECKTNCASGTTHNTGEAIHNAVKAQQRAALLAYPGKARRARTEEQWRAMYATAMKATRAARRLKPELVP